MGQPPQGAAGANPAQTAGILLIVCALAIAIGTFTKSWFGESERGGSVGIGLLGAKMCFGGGECRSLSWGDMSGKGGVDGDIKLFGYLGFVAGLGAMGAAGAAGGMALSRNLHKMPNQKIFLGIFGAASFSFTYFLVRILMQDKVPGLSYSGFLAIGGVVGAGVVFKQMLAPLIARGPAPAYGGGPMMAGAPVAQVAAVPCPRCGGQAGFVAQYNRHFCTACQQYV